MAEQDMPAWWIEGDEFGLSFPTCPEALLEDTPAFLSRAMRAAGTLVGEAEGVARLVHSEPCSVGSTGQKLRLQVEYANGATHLPTELFVKFSRDFSDPVRDGAKIQMESEVCFALLSRMDGFPATVPRVLFADFHRTSGTGILVSEDIAFGTEGIERHYEKCCDSELPDPLGHYRALMRSLARLAAWHRAGKLPDDAMAKLAASSGSLSVSDRQPYSAEQIGRRVDRFREFAQMYPQLLPETIRSEAFLAQLANQAPRFCGHEAAIAAFLAGSPRMTALCHWNANIDNAWFWRDASGELQCGLMDWGNAQVMNVGVALSGCLMGAEPDFLNVHLEGLLGEFARQFEADCGEALDPAELLRHFALHNVCSGLLWLPDAPTIIQRFYPGLEEVKNRFDPDFRANELVRNQLHMLTVLMTLWQKLDFGSRLDQFLGTQAKP
ncbi:MAG: hypothetical protein P8J20_19410 [Novosphingobium sp.]|nr:hypothetical protein [Novosphingobium sp.]